MKPSLLCGRKRWSRFNVQLQSGFRCTPTGKVGDKLMTTKFKNS